MKNFKELKPSFTAFGSGPPCGTGGTGSDALLRSVLPPLVEQFSDGITIARVSEGSAQLLYVNAAFERLTGYARSEVIGKNCRYLQGDEREQPEIALIGAAIRAAKPLDVTLRHYRPDGSALWNGLSLRPFTVGDDLLYLGVVRDVTATRETEIALDRAANLDGATGCLNRQSFIAAAEKRFAARVGWALIVKLDAISFHDINAGYGFDVGDALLIETGRRLRETGAGLVARIGANEFALAFELEEEAGGPPIIARICGALAEDFVVPGARISLRFAMGYALDEPAGDMIALIRNAGAALHASKSDALARPRRFQPVDEEEARHRVRMTRELRVALSNDEFVHHYQPQIDLATGEWVGAEALMRWSHPLFGILPPSRFIEAAERTGLMLDLGERGLAAVAAYACRVNRRRERPLRFSVNVSAAEFLQRDMAATVSRVIRQTGIEPAWLTLELTESMLLDETPGVVEAFRRLRDLGVGLSVDDFGTGYSSLRLLDAFPVTEIKIDQSFVAELPATPSKIIIVRSIIELGRALGLAVVAEGVETEAQQALLASMGCPIGQGFLFGRPQDGEVFAANLRPASVAEQTSRAVTDRKFRPKTPFGSLGAPHPVRDDET